MPNVANVRRSRLFVLYAGRLNCIELPLNPDILPSKPPGESESCNTDPNTKIHDAIGAIAVSFKHGSERVTLHQLADRPDTGAYDDIRGDFDRSSTFQDLFLQDVAEDGIRGDQKDGTTNILTEDHDGHGGGDLGRRDKVLDCDVALEYKEEVSA